jgi:hypothetical protein
VFVRPDPIAGEKDRNPVGTHTSRGTSDAGGILTACEAATNQRALCSRSLRLDGGSARSVLRPTAARGGQHPGDARPWRHPHAHRSVSTLHQRPRALETASGLTRPTSADFVVRLLRRSSRSAPVLVHRAFAVFVHDLVHRPCGATLHERGRSPVEQSQLASRTTLPSSDVPVTMRLPRARSPSGSKPLVRLRIAPSPAPSLASHVDI